MTVGMSLTRDALPPRPNRRRGRRRRRHNRPLRDPLSRAQRRWLVTIMVGWVLTTTWAWTWWLEPSHATSTAALAVNSALLGIETVLLPLWFFFWIWRMKRPDTSIPVPDLRTAIVVTKAPSEPWPVVRATLEAMLAQDFPRPYDTWLADEQPDEATHCWCEARGVRVSTRFGVAAYHQPTWPRRTRCKEGNLAYFYDHHGYDAYDVVVQLDADHVPAPDYMRHMVQPFTDPHVGYVAAPSVCDTNAERSWSARGRLYAEAVLHGPTQAGHSGGYAPSCIGSHYAVRTSALKGIGGLGPEHAEDFTTTLMLSSHGWQGIFAIDAEAHGEGPASLADCLTQEFQWSRSMMNVMLGVSRPYWRGLRRTAKIRLGFCQLWYPLFGLLMLASVLIPIAAIVLRTPFMRVSLVQFYGHFAPSMLTLLLVVLWLRGLAFLRPRTAHAVSWEMALFQLVRWPWALLGCVHAVAGRLAGREFAFKVTPKGREGAAPLPMRILAPYLLIALVSASPFLLQLDGGPARGYRTLALLNVGLYLFAAFAILLLHVHEHPRELRREVVRAATTKFGVTVVATTVVAVALLQPRPLHGPEVVQARATIPWPVTTLAPGQLALGVTTDALAKNSTAPWAAPDLDEVNAFEQAARAHAAVVQWFADWAHTPRPDVAQLKLIAARGATPQISWEPWDYTRGLSRSQPGYRLAVIAGGRYDGYIRTWARDLRAYGRPVLLRFAHEMNGSWYPWGQSSNGNRRGDYRRAWRHVHDIFRAEGASNVRWVWSPVARTLDRLDYPGDDAVDVLGLSGFNGGTALDWSGWRSFADIFGPALTQLEAIAPHKPIQISEVGSAEAGGSKALWVTRMFTFLHGHPSVRSLVWFDLRKQTDWRITSSPDAAQAFAAGLAAGRR
jgi:cellulose synthase (UDP-forming)